MARAQPEPGQHQQPHAGGQPWPSQGEATSLQPQLDMVNQESEPLPGATSTTRLRSALLVPRRCGLDGEATLGRGNALSTALTPVCAGHSTPGNDMPGIPHRPLLGVPQPNPFSSQSKQGNAAYWTSWLADKGTESSLGPAALHLIKIWNQSRARQGRGWWRKVTWKFPHTDPGAARAW